MAAPSTTMTSTGSAVPRMPSTGCGSTVYSPGGSATNAAPDASSATLEISLPSASRILTTAPTTGRGAQAGSGAKALQAVLAGLTGQDEAPKLAAINQFFNRRVVFTPDAEVWEEVQAEHGN